MTLLSKGFMMNLESLIQNPALDGIDPVKLQLLFSLAAQAGNKKQNELLPFLMSAVTGPKEKQLSFQPSEIDSIIEVLKIGKSPQEIQQIERACTLMRQFRTAQGSRKPSAQTQK